MRPPRPVERVGMVIGGWVFGHALCQAVLAYKRWQAVRWQEAETRRLEAVWRRLGEQREKPLLS